MKKALFFIFLGCFLMGTILAQTSKTMYVSVKNAAIKSGTGFFAKELAKLNLGTTLTVLQQKDKWMQVRTGTQPVITGWIASASLTSKRITASGSSASAGEIALAGKGFSPGMELEYKAGAGLDYSIIDAMESQTIPNEKILGFITEGRLKKGE
ncbi:MAG: hypothetical protein LBP76_08450 [Treponema sp.]|jgi:uncharacterized protein YgiM (DUF1202 family)|nr:hypothetical protein [Treponema sp.]